MGIGIALNSQDGGNNSGWSFITEYFDVRSGSQLSDPGAIIDLFELDYSNLTGGEVLYFHAGVNGLGSDVVWQGRVYSRYPIDVEGFERSSSGTLPRPKIKVANILGSISSLAYTYQDLVGTKLTRRRTFLKYLDAVNFIGGYNLTADPNVGFTDEIWTVDRKSAENMIFVEFELAAAFDVAGVLLPRRHCIQNTCTWAYRSAECGFTGGAVATKNDITVPGVSGTYTRTLSTITAAVTGSWNTNDVFNMTFTPNSATSAKYTVVTGGTTSFTVTSAVSRTAAGNCIIRANETNVSDLSAPYSQSGTTITVTATGTWVSSEVYQIDIIANPSVHGIYTITAGGTNTFTVSTSDSGTITGTCIVHNGDVSQDRCGKRLSSCKLRFGELAELPFGAFPGVGLMRS
jgi:lambda family phage minor tail protein L